MTFTAFSLVNNTQDIIDNNQEKRRKGVFGPPVGCKMIVSIEDLQMPMRDIYGS